MLKGTKINNFNEKNIYRRIRKQRKHLLKLVSRNFEITMKEIKSIKIELNDLKKSI